jgi:hypothetical protein
LLSSGFGLNCLILAGIPALLRFNFEAKHTGKNGGDNCGCGKMDKERSITSSELVDRIRPQPVKVGR